MDDLDLGPFRVGTRWLYNDYGYKVHMMRFEEEGRSRWMERFIDFELILVDNDPTLGGIQLHLGSQLAFDVLPNWHIHRVEPVHVFSPHVFFGFDVPCSIPTMIKLNALWWKN